MKIDCNVIKDLLPLYADDLASSESRALVDEHICSCPDCKKELEALKAGEIKSVVDSIKVDEKEAKAPIKKVKRRITLAIVIACAVSIIAGFLVFLGISRPVKTLEIIHVESEMYTQEQMDEAIAAIRADFTELEGCQLLKLKYAGDDKVHKEWDYLHGYDPDAKTVMVFNSEFRTPLFGGDDAWNHNTIYTWDWFVVEHADGTWEVVTKGYC